MSATEDIRVLEAFRRMAAALKRVDEIEKVRSAALEELAAAEGEWRTLARKAGS